MNFGKTEKINVLKKCNQSNLFGGNSQPSLDYFSQKK